MIIYLYVNFHVLRCLEIQRRFEWFRIVQGPFRTLVGAAPGSSALDRGCWNETTQQWLNNSNNELVISEMYSNYFKCSQKLMKYHVSKRIRKGVRTKTFRSDSQKCTEVTWLISHFCSQLWTLRNGCACCQIWFVLHRRPISRQIYRIYLTRSKRLHWIHHNSPLACQLVISLSSACHQLITEPGWARLSPSRSRRSRRSRKSRRSRRAFGLETWPRWSPAPQFRRRGHRTDTVRTPWTPRCRFVPSQVGRSAGSRGGSLWKVDLWWSCENMWEYLTSFNINLQFMNIYDYLILFVLLYWDVFESSWS